jgi:hypothetical protein
MKNKLKIIKKYKDKKKSKVYDLANCSNDVLHDAVAILTYYKVIVGTDLDLWEPKVKVKLNGKALSLHRAHEYVSKLYHYRMTKTRIRNRKRRKDK